MATGPAAHLLRHIRRLAAAQATERLADRELLERFTREQDEAAFTTLLRRHGPMVLRVCQRVLSQPADAEDVFQATFLLLVRKASTLRGQDSVGSWLYGVAYRLALKAGRAAARRRAHESRAPSRPAADPLAEITLREAQALFDQALNHLPERFRAPLVLCYLEGLTRDEAAREFGCSVSTLKRRLEQGRELLRSRLVRRGVTLSTALLAAALSENACTAAVPAATAAATLQAALQLAAGQAMAGAVSANVAALVDAASKSLFVIKLKTAAILLAGLCVLGAGAVVAQRVSTEKDPAAQRAEASTAIAKGQGPAKREQPQSEQLKKPRTDLYGDPLPVGALTRLGTVRWRHGDQVTALAYSSDGKMLASGSMDEAIHLWDAETGQLLRIFRGHTGWVTSVYFTPDGKRLISSGWDNTARVWEVTTGKQLRRWQTQGGWKAALSADGKLLAVPGGGPPQWTIVLWDVATGKKVRELPFEDKQDSVIDLAFYANGKRLVSGGGSTLRLFDVVAGKQLQTFGPGGRINSIACSADGKTLAVGRNDEPASLWDAATLQPVRSLGGAPKGARAVAFAPDGKTLAVAEHGAIALWDPATGRKLRDLPGTPYQVWCMSFAPDGRTLAVGNLASVIHLYDAATGKELPASTGGHREWLSFMAFADRDRAIVSISSEGLVRQWELATAKVSREFREEGTYSYCGDLSPDGRTLASGEQMGAHLFDCATGKKLRVLKGNKYQLWAVAFSPKGDVLAFAGNLDPNILLGDVATGRELRRIPTPFLMGVPCLAWSPNGKVLASAGVKVNQLGRGIHTVCLSDPAGKQLGEWTAHEPGAESYMHGVTALAFSPDGALLASAGADKTIGLWHTATGTLRTRLLGHQRGVTAVAFSPDGRMVASGGMDRTVRLWELATGKERHRYEGHLGRIWKLAFSADGRMLASASGDTSVLVWSIIDSPGQRAVGDLSRDRLNSLWSDLATNDASTAYRAMGKLTAVPKQTVSWLQGHLPALTAAGPPQMARLIADLDAERFAVRENAEQELEKIGASAEPALQRALAGQPSAEVRRRIERLLDRLATATPTGKQLQALRAVEVLEYIGTPEAQALLKGLANGAPEARLTQEAKVSLDRLGRRKAPIN